MLNLDEKGTDSLPLIQYAYIVAYLCFQGETLAFDEKDSFKEELKEE